LRSGLNFTLTTDAGEFALIGEVTGVGGYESVEGAAAMMEVFGRSVRVLGLDGLEQAKRASGRIKNLADLAEILEIRRRSTR
jgi:hypothetical protein